MCIHTRAQEGLSRGSAQLLKQLAAVCRVLGGFGGELCPLRAGTARNPQPEIQLGVKNQTVCVLGEFIRFTFLLKAGQGYYCALLQLCGHESRVLRHLYFHRPALPPVLFAQLYLALIAVLQTDRSRVVRFS